MLVLVIIYYQDKLDINKHLINLYQIKVILFFLQIIIVLKPIKDNYINQY